MFEQLNKNREDEAGFTLIELLIAIVVVGALAATVILGVSGLTDNGKKGACKVSLDAAKAATAVFYSNKNGTYPTVWTDLTTAVAPAQPILDLDTAVVIDPADATGKTLKKGTDWSIVMSAGGANPTVLTPSASCA